MKPGSSKLIQALADYCAKYNTDPNLFPKGPVVSEHPECNTDDLNAIHRKECHQGEVIDA